MDNFQLRNPYDYRNPVRDAAVFAGRGKEVTAIEYELAQADVDRPSVCIVLHGPRAAGKTSLLYATERVAAAGGLTTARVELIQGDGEPVTFFRKLYDELVLAVVTAAEQSGKPLPFGVSAVRRVMAGAGDAASVSPLQFPEAVSLVAAGGRVPEAALRTDLSYFVRWLGHPIALLVDEAQLMVEDAQALSVLRFLATRVDGLVLVLAGTSGLINRITEVHSPILRQFKEFEVRGFAERDDVRDCIVRPLHSAGVFGLGDDDLVSSLSQLTDGNPYEIQLYCHEMFARMQRGLADDLELTPEVLEDIRRRMESGSRDVLDRPLIRAVRAMNPRELIAFNVLTSALGHATPDEAWFAYCMTGPPEIKRAEFDESRNALVAQGILAPGQILRFAIDTELFDEIYARLWTVGILAKSQHTRAITSRTDVRGMLIDQLFGLLQGFANEHLQIYPTFGSQMNAEHLEESFRALETLPGAGPDSVPAVSFLHYAILSAGEPAALDVTTLTCTFRNHTVERWLFAADKEDIALAQTASFRAASDRIEALGGRLTAEQVRLPLRSWPAEDWFQIATGDLRTELAKNHCLVAYDAYESSDATRAWTQFQSSYALHQGWEEANCLAYLSLATRRWNIAIEWSLRALELADKPWDRALSHYNTAMAYHLAGDKDGVAEQLAHSAAVLDSISMPTHLIFYLLLPDPDDTRRLREEKSVDLVEAVQRARTALGVTQATDPQDVPDTTARVARPPVVLSVATEWTSSHGGLSTFNRDLCVALAAAGAEVFCMVLDATGADIADADELRVKLLLARKRPGASDDLRLAGRPELPDGTLPDLILGHGRITGPAAQGLADNFFPAARRLHFVHMAPDEIEWYKPAPEGGAGLKADRRTGIERELGRTAHRVVTVGPWLHDQFLAEVKSPAGLSPLQLDPGFDSGPPGAADREPPKGRARVLLLGRVEDAELKGVPLAAAACGMVEKWLQDEALRGIQLLVRGAPETRVDETREKILVWAKSPRLSVVVRAYTTEQDRIEDDLNSASLVIMPSRKEGFGLAGVEAITRVIPVLVGSDSGLAELLRDKLGRERASQCVVELSGDDKKDTQRWARAIERKLRDREAAFKRAAQLRKELARRVTWADAAALVLGEIPDQ
ncbi:glycosyltransferase [Streptomyces liliifuscus]|uniref:Glycosyltransferase n=1 Tax=Streptomyces liliifuscus TaxID=2797636 RepID=A0A7T7I5C3_9ACTN|nr:AAA family ATPase [Streptomyces liliifuscus]QQM41143.1 glycosyltransferase [Streptomyces liliifuscus]